MIEDFLFNAENGWALRLILVMQSFRSPPLTALATLFHVIGSEVFILPIVIFVYWSWDKHLGRRLLPFLMLASWLNAAFKEALRRPRPFNMSPEVLERTPQFALERSYGIPSGHTQNATVAGGIAANAFRRWAILAFTVLYAVLTGFSRMILGAHFPQDIAAGLLIGLVLLGVYGAVEPQFSKWLGRQRTAVKIVGVIALTAIMIAIHPGLIRPTSPLWLTEPIPDENLLARAMVSVGSFLGIGIGLVLEDHYVRFDSQGSWSQRIMRVIIGGLGAALLFYTLAPLSSLLIAGAGDMVRFAAIGLWIAFGAPLLFVRLDLAARTVKADPYAELN